MRTLAIALLSCVAASAQMLPMGSIHLAAGGGGGTIISRSLTVGTTAASESNFPFPVKLHDATLRNVANGGHVASMSAYDVVFYSDSGLTTRIPAERERYTESTGEWIGWVKPATTNTGTVIYVAYGDTSLTTDQNLDATYGTTSVWTNAFVAAWHFPNGTTLTAGDSTSTGANGTLHGSPTATTGKIDGGAALASASSQYVDIASNSAFSVTDFTVSGWFKTSTAADQDIMRHDDGVGNRHWLLRVNANGTVLAYLIYASNPSITTSGTYADGAWHHVAMTVSYSGGNSVLSLYIDGVSQGTPQGGVGSNPVSALPDPLIGGYITGGSPSETFNGSLDELRFANVGRSANWIADEHSSQDNPGDIGVPGFYTVGNEVTH